MLATVHVATMFWKIQKVTDAQWPLRCEKSAIKTADAVNSAMNRWPPMQWTVLMQWTVPSRPPMNSAKKNLHRCSEQKMTTAHKQNRPPMQHRDPYRHGYQLGFSRTIRFALCKHKTHKIGFAEREAYQYWGFLN